MGAIRVEDLCSDPRVSEVLITNRTPARADELAEKFGASTIAWDLAKEATADAFVVATGTDAHEEILRAILPKGVPVLCEKPISLDLPSTEKIISLAKQTGAKIQIGFQRRFDSSFMAIKESIESGRIGTLYSLTMTSHDKTPSEKHFIAGSGGIFRDLHVHDFDLIRWLTGQEVESVFATKSVRENRDYAEFDDADVSSVIATTANGVQVIVTGTRHDALGQDVRIEAFGSKDSLSAGLNARTPLNTVEGELRTNLNAYGGFVDRFRDAFRAETKSFVSFVNGEIENPCPPEAALESLRIAIACEESILSHSAVAVAGVL